MNTFESFYDFTIYDENQKTMNPELLADHAIKSYILEKIEQKATNYPHFLNLNFKTQRDFDIFNKNLIGEIYRQFLNITRAAKKYNPIAKTKTEKKLEKAVISFLDLKGVSTVSLNTPINQDGKYTELMDLIPSKQWTTYEEAEDALLFDAEVIKNDEIKVKPKYSKRQPEQATKNLQTAFAF